MANLQYTADIIKAALHDVGELTDGTSPYHSKALEYVNDAFLKLLAASNPFGLDVGEIWRWAVADYPGVFQLNPVHEDGTVSLTKGSVNGSFSSAPSTSMAGRFLKITDRPEVFRIATHTAATTSFTLDAAYTDTTGATLSYKAIQLDYSTSGNSILRLAGPMTVYRNQSDFEKPGQIVEMDAVAFREKYPLNKIEKGIPQHFAVMKDADGVIRVRFSHYPDTETRVEYDRIDVPTALTDGVSEVPGVPREFRCLLEYQAAYRLAGDKNDPQREAKYLGLVTNTFAALKTSERKEKTTGGKNFARLMPRQDKLGTRNLSYGYDAE